MKIKLQLRADLTLVLVNVIAGSIFIVTKIGLNDIPPLTYTSIRFAIAFCLMGLVFGKKFKKVGFKTLSAGIILGIFLAIGFNAQTMGLAHTTASKAAFITGLAVILTPIISIFITKKLPTLYLWIGALLAFIGLAILSLESGTSLAVGVGEFLVFLCAVAFAFHISLTGKYSPNLDTSILTTIQVGVTALITGVIAVLTEQFPTKVSEATWLGLLYMGVIATALVILMQTWAQKYTSPTRTAILFTLEPVFAAILAYLVLSEEITVKTIVGGLLILGGILLAEMKGEGSEKSKEENKRL